VGRPRDAIAVPTPPPVSDCPVVTACPRLAGGCAVGGFSYSGAALARELLERGHQAGADGPVRGSAPYAERRVTLSPGTVLLASLQIRRDNVHLHVVETDRVGSFTAYLTAVPPVDVVIGWLAIG
jgi:hypothetical protein